MKNIVFAVAAVAAFMSSADVVVGHAELDGMPLVVSDAVYHRYYCDQACKTNDPSVVSIEQKIELMWTDYTNRMARAEAARLRREERTKAEAEAAKPKSSVETVRDNLKKHQRGMKKGVRK